jgi:hypothetical protein
VPSMSKSDHNATYEVAVVVDFASVATVTAAEQTMTVAGVDPAYDECLAVVPQGGTLEAGVAIAGCRVSAVNTVAVKLVNPTAGAVDPASRTYKVILARH